MGKDPYVGGRCLEIDNALSEAAVWASTDNKLGAYLAGHITILIAGVVEDTVEYLFNRRVQKTGDHEIEALFSRMIGQQFRNPFHAQITTLLKACSGPLCDSYLNKIPPGAPNALDSIVDNKNSLSHTGTWKMQMTVRDVKEYWGKIAQILDAIDEVLA